ncbi:MAG: dusA [Nevskia sp.]|nr:dusA [Nevskia sp.]
MTLTATNPWRFCVAPMMDWTTPACRYFHRQASRHARLYTEMINAGAIVHGDAERHLRFDAAEHPVALQLGGAEPQLLAQAASIGAAFGYDEINLNCGCPSDRVQEGRFGACLMLEPQRVADCVQAMREVCTIPVTVKCRIGVDDSADYAFLQRFVDIVSTAGASTFIVHARKAWLNGLSPKQNREVPPLSYPTVLRLKQDFPQLTLVLNGGLSTLDQCEAQLEQLDGVMLGRAAYDDPYLLTAVDARLFGDRTARPSRAQLLRRMQPYVERELAAGTSLARITRHVLGLYRGEPGGRAFRRVLSEQAPRAGAGWPVIETALAATLATPHAAAA